MTTFRRIIESLRLPQAERAELERLVELPEVQRALDSLDAETVAHRRQLVSAIADAERRQATAKTQATAALRDAEQRLAAAQAELDAAADAHRAAFVGSLNGAEAATRRAIAEATAELVSSADPRIAEFRRHVANLAESLRLAVVHRVTSGPPNILGRRLPIPFTNSTEVQAATDACNECLRDLDSMRLAALSRFEITERLGDWGGRLQDAAAQFDLPLPIVDEFGDVTSTRSGPGAPAVIVERQAKADELAAAAAERMARQG
jgi:hypothetical protein